MYIQSGQNIQNTNQISKIQDSSRHKSLLKPEVKSGAPEIRFWTLEVHVGLMKIILLVFFSKIKTFEIYFTLIFIFNLPNILQIYKCQKW